LQNNRKKKKSPLDPRKLAHYLRRELSFSRKRAGSIGGKSCTKNLQILNETNKYEDRGRLLQRKSDGSEFGKGGKRVARRGKAHRARAGKNQNQLNCSQGHTIWGGLTGGLKRGGKEHPNHMTSDKKVVRDPQKGDLQKSPGDVRHCANFPGYGGPRQKKGAAPQGKKRPLVEKTGALWKKARRSFRNAMGLTSMDEGTFEKA